MSVPGEWVCPAENNGYNAWQAMLFHYTVMTHIGRPPIIAVMADEDDELLPEFDVIAEMGGNVQRCPNYRGMGFADYAPRNTAGALLSITPVTNYIVMCDTDFLLTREPYCPPLQPGEITVDNLPWYFMKPEDPLIVDLFEGYLERAGLHREEVLEPRIWGHVPTVIPTEVMRSLGHEWLACTEVCLPQCEEDPTEFYWEAIMWGFMFACARLGLRKIRTSWCTHNGTGTEKFDPWYPIIHYAWGEKEEFSKFERHEFPREPLTATPGSINERVVQQIEGAREWYGSHLDSLPHRDQPEVGVAGEPATAGVT